MNYFVIGQDKSLEALDNAVAPIVEEETSGLQKAITSGTNAPSGGSDGDIYIQY